MSRILEPSKGIPYVFTLERVRIHDHSISARARTPLPLLEKGADTSQKCGHFQGFCWYINITCKQTFKTRVLVDSDSPLLLLSTLNDFRPLLICTQKVLESVRTGGHFLQNRLRTPSEALEKRTCGQ